MIVESLWAIINVVLSRDNLAKDCCIKVSDSVSNALVASSSKSIGALLKAKLLQ